MCVIFQLIKRSNFELITPVFCIFQAENCVRLFFVIFYFFNRFDQGLSNQPILINLAPQQYLKLKYCFGFMNHSENLIRMPRNISRTSSEKSSDPNQAEIEKKLGQNGVEIERVNSMNNLSFQDIIVEKHNEGQQSFSNGEVEKMEESELSQYKLKAKLYRTYQQMCKDLQFIQMLGNPRYVIALFDMGYFYNQDFRDYIQGLKMFLKKPELMRLIKFPEGLYNLELMLKKGFVQALEVPSLRDKFVVNCLHRNIEMKNNFRKWRNFDAIPPMSQPKQS